MFTFFLKSYRVGILDFCGQDVNVNFNINLDDGKNSFKNFDNGLYSKDEIFNGIETRHPNLLKSVIIGKKGWGLWKNEWSKGISEWSFTIDEIVNEFEKHNIVIPEPLMVDFKNTIQRMRYK